MANGTVQTKTRQEILLPKMGESITEATIINWEKQVGDWVEEDETIVEIATDKVDSEVPSPFSGKIIEIKYENDTVVPVGAVIAIIETDATEEDTPIATPTVEQQTIADDINTTTGSAIKNTSSDGRFYSPLVRNIAQQENINQAELDQLQGSGHGGRVTKNDILKYIENRNRQPQVQPQIQKSTPPNKQTSISKPQHINTSTHQHINTSTPQYTNGNVEIIEMDRMRKLIAHHMVESKRTSPHVTSFVEVDVTEMVNWRNSIKKQFQAKYGEKITFTPLFVEAVAKAISDFPMINVSVDGNHIILKKDINIGIATALPSGNLIVPVVKNANHKNLFGLTKTVNDLVGRARNNKLKPDDIQGGTFTLTNVGTFGNDAGTPIINQPQVAILATGAIRKKPAVVETKYGDVIAIRQMMMMSLSYDHRVVDGFLGGSFLRRVGDYLEGFQGGNI